jgi:hypothetical protein
VVAEGLTVMPRNARQEALCRAYVQAVAARAGVGYLAPGADFGTDLSLRGIEHEGNKYRDSSVQLDLQLKSTTRAGVTDSSVVYDLPVRNYDYLRALTSWNHRLLVVLVLPEREEDWMTQTVDELILRHAAFWYSLRGAGPTDATSSRRVTIPRTQLFGADALLAMLARVGEGGLP